MAEDELLPESLKGFSVSSSSSHDRPSPSPHTPPKGVQKEHKHHPPPHPQKRKWQLERSAVVCAGTKKGEGKGEET